MSEDRGDLFHHVIPADGAVDAVQVLRRDGRLREGTAAREAAAAAIGAGHDMFHVVDPRIFLHPEPPGDQEERQREQETDAGNDDDGPYKGIDRSDHIEWLLVFK